MQRDWTEHIAPTASTHRNEEVAVTPAAAAAAHVPQPSTESRQLPHLTLIVHIHQLAHLTLVVHIRRPCHHLVCSRYAAYHHLRSMGWVPKSGVKFGVDFLAYRKGPEFYHSSYSVMVRAVDSVTLEPVPADGCNTRVVTWATLANLNRLSSQVPYPFSCPLLKTRLWRVDRPQ
jgi:hypothetical protein